MHPNQWGEILPVSVNIGASRLQQPGFVDRLRPLLGAHPHVKHLPAEVIKIDQSFVRDMMSDPDDLAIVKGVIGLALAFQREVIAEGVETAVHGVQLLVLGVELAQGYGIARPMPAHAVREWVARWQQDAAWLA